MPSGTTVTATPSTRIPEPWAISQPSAPTRRPSRGAPCAPASAEEPADDADRQADEQRRAGGSDAAEDGDQDQRPAVPRVGAVTGPGQGRGRTREQRSHGSAIITRRNAPDRGSHAGSVLMSRSGYRGARHEGPRRVRPVLQGRPHPPAAADVLPHWRPPILARGGPRRVRRDLAPLAQGLPARGPRGVDPGPGLLARAAPAHREAVAPREGPRPRGEGDPRRAREAAGDAAPDAAADRAHHRLARRDGPRGRPAPHRRRARAADGDRPVRRAPRRTHHEHPHRCSTPVREHVGEGSLAAAHDHPSRRRRPASYPHRDRRRRDHRRAGRHRHPRHRRRRRPPDALAGADGRRARRHERAQGRARAGRPPRGGDAPVDRRRAAGARHRLDRHRHRRQHRRRRPGDAVPGVPVRRPRQRGRPGADLRVGRAQGPGHGDPGRRGLDRTAGRRRARSTPRSTGSPAATRTGPS